MYHTVLYYTQAAVCVNTNLTAHRLGSIFYYENESGHSVLCCTVLYCIILNYIVLYNTLHYANPVVY